MNKRGCSNEEKIRNQRMKHNIMLKEGGMNLHLWETTTSLQKVIFFLDLIGPNLNTHQTFIIQLWNEGSGLEVTMSSPIWTSHSLLSFINNFYQMDEYL